MNREKWPLLIFIFTGLGICYLSPIAAGQLVEKKSPSRETRLLTPQPAVEGATARMSPEVKALEQVVDERPRWGRNPFLTEEEEARAGEIKVEGLKVQGIIVGLPRSVATLDGQTVMVGEKIGEETVVQIRENAVVLERGGRKRIIKIREPSISIQAMDEEK